MPDPCFEENGVTIYAGDVRDILPALPSESIHCTVTSPPYWGLRNYGILPSIWDGDPACEHRFEFGAPTSETNYVDKRRWQHTRNGRDEEQPPEKRVGWKRETIEHGQFCRCGAWLGCFGLEPNPELYVEHGVHIFREVRRVLRDDGTLWLNIGDSYSAHRGQRKETDKAGEKQQTKRGSTECPSRCVDGLKPKDLVGIPWMLAFALRADGWYLRQDIIWSKPNPMPESVTDRCTKSHEYLFLLSKSERYYFDQEAILEPVSPGTHDRLSQDVQNQIGSERDHAGGKTNGNMKAVGRHLPGNRTHKGTTAYENGATEHRTKAGLVAYADKMRKLAAAGSGTKNNESFDAAMAIMPDKRNKRSVWQVTTQPFAEAHFATFPEDLIKPCILAGCPGGGTVLDPFLGSGTTGLVARANGCRCIGVELNPEYIEIAAKRLGQHVLQF